MPLTRNAGTPGHHAPAPTRTHVPTPAQLLEAWEWEAAHRPHAEKECAQYMRGLLTLPELIAGLIVIAAE